MILFDAIRQEILTHLGRALELPAESLLLEIPPEPKLGDFAFPTFRLAKSLRKAPPVIAKELTQRLIQEAQISRLCAVRQEGPYVNFTVHPDVLVTDVLEGLLLSGSTLGTATQHRPNGKKPVLVLEYSSPNVAKPFNIYHLRTTMLGNCLQRVFEARGFSVISYNHLGDWGTQFGTLALAFDQWGNEEELNKRGIHYLVELYVRINQEIEKNEALAETARQYFKRLELGDLAVRKAWQKFIDLSLREFNRIYARLGVRFDKIQGESFYIDHIPALEAELNKLHLIRESEGAQVVSLDAFSMPPCIIRKQDGSTIYATRDLAAACYRYETSPFEKMIYVVGSEQKLHFAQLFKVLDLMQKPWAKSCVHVDCGLYRFQDAKMSTRKGNFITLESVLDQAVERVREIMAAKQAADQERSDPVEPAGNHAVTASSLAEDAEKIGVGAIVFNDLSTDRNTDVNFDLNAALDFNGETGPYIQYAHTRCLSILRNAPPQLLGDIRIDQLLDLGADQKGFERLAVAAHTAFEAGATGSTERIGLRSEEELWLLRMAARFPLVLDTVIDTYRPSHLASYLLDVTKAFNSFYRAHKVLVEDTTVAKGRLALVLATQRVLLQGMTFLGMRAPNRM